MKTLKRSSIFILALAMILSMAIPVMAAELTDYVRLQATDGRVTLHGTAPGIVTVTLQATDEMRIAGIEGAWSTTETEGSGYLTLNMITSEGFNFSGDNVADAETGVTVWMDYTVGDNPFEATKDTAIMTAAYTVPADTPAGTYTVAFRMKALWTFEEGEDSRNDGTWWEDSVTYTATITVMHHDHVPAAAVEENCVEADCENAGSYDEVIYCADPECGEELSRNTVEIPALGHRVSMHAGQIIDPVDFKSDGFTREDNVFRSTNYKSHTASNFNIKAIYPCTLKLIYGVSSEQSFDYLKIYHNGTEKDAISGEVDGKEMTLTLAVGDSVTISYSKDMSNSEGRDCGWFTTEFDRVTLTEKYVVPAEFFSPTCTKSIVCDFCGEELYGALGHTWGDITYNWTEDARICSARRICGRDTRHIIVANSTITSKVTKEPTATEMGETTYTATFTIDWAETQTLTLANIPIPTSIVELDLADGSIVITQADGISIFTQGENEIRTTAGAGIITQSNSDVATANTITVESGKVDLTISGLNIASTTGAAIDIKDGAVLNLNLTGENTVIADDYCAGVEVAEGAALTIDGSGSLYAEGAAQGAGIGSGWNRNSGVITINGGTITPAGESTAASLGGGSKGSATIIINGGVVNAAQKGSWPAPAIGSGDAGEGSTITITGGTVNATAGHSGVAIGGGITGSGSTITITGGNVTAVGGIYSGVGIGSDRKNAGGSVYISNAVVKASGYYSAIGGRGAGNDYGLDSVVIEDSATVTLSHKSGADVQEKIFLTTPAADASAYEGETVTFSVEAEGASGLTYQWLYSKTDTGTWIELAGENSNTLTVPVTAENDGYYYHCRMTNGWGNQLVSSAQLHLLEDVRGIEYTINSMGMYDIDTHEAYKAIPQDQFLLEVEVTNDCSNEIDTILLVQYSPEGQMLGMQYLYGRTSIGETYIFGASVDNRDGAIGCIKAFVVPQVGNMIPLAESMEIGECKEEDPVEAYTMHVMVAGNTATITVEGELPADSGVQVMLWKDGKYSNVGYATWVGVVDGIHTYTFQNNMTEDYEFAFKLIVDGEVLATETIVVPR